MTLFMRYKIFTNKGLPLKDSEGNVVKDVDGNDKICGGLLNAVINEMQFTSTVKKLHKHFVEFMHEFVIQKALELIGNKKNDQVYSRELGLQGIKGTESRQ